MADDPKAQLVARTPARDFATPKHGVLIPPREDDRPLATTPSHGVPRGQFDDAPNSQVHVDPIDEIRVRLKRNQATTESAASAGEAALEKIKIVEGDIAGVKDDVRLLHGQQGALALAVAEVKGNTGVVSTVLPELLSLVRQRDAASSAVASGKLDDANHERKTKRERGNKWLELVTAVFSGGLIAVLITLYARGC